MKRKDKKHFSQKCGLRELVTVFSTIEESL